MNAFTAPALAAAALLIGTGTAKVLRPLPTVRALQSVGWPGPAPLVRAGAVAESALGLASLLIGNHVLLALTAASYAGFSAFVVVAIHRGGVVASCGCVGRDDTPPTIAHVVLTAALAALSAAAAYDGDAGLLTAAGPLSDRFLAAGFAVLIGWLGWLALSQLPRLHVRTE